MSVAARARRLHRWTSALTLLLFVAAIWVLHREVREVSLADVIAGFAALPASSLALAAGFTVASYFFLTFYDFLALTYIRRELRPRDTFLTSFLAFAFSNTIGMAFVSGGAVRYRLFTGFGLSAGEVAEIILFNTLTISLGFSVLGGILLLVEPEGVARLFGVVPGVAWWIGAAILALDAVYLVAAVFWKRSLPIGRYRLRFPSFRLTLKQVTVAAFDLSVAAAVVYVLMPTQSHVDFEAFLGVYVLAAVASILSHVPAGLGVFETIVVVMVADVPKAAVLGALLAYRIIYFLVPLALGMVVLALHELRRATAPTTLAAEEPPP